ncbi:unnamed protein product [Kluyveromyces dobzhanskii CBS 2104]|uniref:WGS project CCBQ000000000 data, contig 00106 n=1 Tax=Kluyveromyces dobzhanskii CBS 2104 TaxID=1427455 RepID=A0A0A8L501_9SACH|nr:unnamed protein product [Kluyveromyces dobzhanskii CBS 2104]
MSFGVPLSQLIQARADHVRSGIKSLDDSLSDGFQPQCIYEVYGPPGIGKTKFGVQLVNKNQGKAKCLWIDTFKQVPIQLVERTSEEEPGAARCQFTRIKKFAQLWFMFQNLKEAYGLIIIDGLSQLLVDYLQMYEKNSGIPNSGQRVPLHDFKVKSLIQLLVAITKYAKANNTVIILLNDAMNTGYQDYSEDAVVSYNNTKNTKSESFSNFLVKSQRKRHVQVLKSGLVANAAVGGKDARWEVFLRCRIGIFWNWAIDASQNTPPKIQVARRTIPHVIRQFVIQHHQPLGSTNTYACVKTDESGNFCDFHVTPLPDTSENPVINTISPQRPATKKRRILVPTGVNPSSLTAFATQSHSQPITPNSSQSIQYTPRIIHSDIVLPSNDANDRESDIVYDSEG